MPQTRQHIEGERPLRQRRTAEGVLMTEDEPLGGDGKVLPPEAEEVL